MVLIGDVWRAKAQGQGRTPVKARKHHSISHAARSKPRRAESKKALPQSVYPDKPDHFDQLRYRAFQAIAEARKRLDPNYLLHPQDSESKEAAIKQARDFLRDLANEARATRKPRGDSATAKENTKMLAVLWRLNRSDTLKQIVIDQAGEEGYEGRMRSLSVRIKRFSRRVCDALTARYGYLPAELLQESPASDAHIADTFRRWPGVHLPDHISALREALKRGSPRKR